ncbi:DUF6683 family protein [Caulobacter segnis]
MTLRRLAPLLAAVILVGLPAAAQDMPTVLPQGFELNSILNQQRVDAAINSGRSRAPARPTAKPATTAYASSPAVSQRVRRQFADWVGKQSGPEAGQRIAGILSTGDPVKSWAGIVGGDGLRPGDVADALAGYWVLNWVMANGADNNRAQAQGALRQVRGLIADNPAYARLGPTQRQEMAETLMLNFLLQHAAYVDAMKRGDRDLARRLGDAANARFKNEMGVNLRQLNLTPAGFVRRA